MIERDAKRQNLCFLLEVDIATEFHLLGFTHKKLIKIITSGLSVFTIKGIQSGIYHEKLFIRRFRFLSKTQISLLS